MPVRFILGRAGSGKTHECLEQIAAEIKQAVHGPLLALLTPEQASFQYERRLLDRVEGRASVRTAALSFHRLAHRVFQDLGAPAAPPLGGVGRQMMLRSVLAGFKGRFRLFDRSCSRPGFVDRLSASITELKNYGVTPAELESEFDRLDREGRGDSILAAKVHDMALIYAEYDRRIADRFTDPDDILALTAVELERWDKLPEARFWIDGFAGFTPRELEIVRLLCLRADQVWIALCVDADELPRPGEQPALAPGSAFQPTIKTWARLQTLLAQSGVEQLEPMVLNPDPAPRFSAAPDLAHLEREFGNRPARPRTGRPEAVRVLVAADRRTEVVQAARRIRVLVRDQGLRYRDLAVSLRRLDNYAELIEEVFPDYGIPFFLDRKPEVGGHPLIELVRSVVETAATNWAPEPVFRALKTDLFPLDRDQVDLLENYVLAQGVRGRSWTMSEPWRHGRHYAAGEESEHDGVEPDLIREIDGLRVRVAELLEPCVGVLRSALSRGAPAVELGRGVWELLERLDAASALSAWPVEPGVIDPLLAAREHVQVYNGVADLLDELAAAMGDEPMKLEDFRAVMESGLEALRLRLIPPTLDTVLVGAVERSRNPELKAMLILGANEKEFPAAPRPDPVFADEERELLERHGIELGPSGRVRTFHENFFVYIALTRAWESLWISCHAADESGRESLGSAMLDRVLEIFPDLEPERAFPGLEPVGAGPWSVAETADEYALALARELGAAFQGRGLAPGTPSAYNAALDMPLVRSALAPVVLGLGLRNRPGNLDRAQAEALFGRGGFTASVSRLESFARCPFRHFAEYGLRLRPREVFDFESTEFGVLVHAALERLYKDSECGEGMLPPDEQRRKALLARTLDALLPEIKNELFLNDARYRIMAANMKRLIEFAVEVLAEHERLGGFRTVGAEVSFGFDGEGMAPLVIDLDGERTVRLRGVIDRLDSAPAADGVSVWVRIIDFKTYRRGWDLKRLDHGLDLQLPLYLAAVLEGGEPLLGAPALPGGAFYMPIVDAVVRTDEPDPDALRQARIKDLKLVGIMARDLELVRLMDRECVRYSKLIPAALKSGGAEFAANSTSTLGVDELRGLCELALGRARALAARVYDGEIDVAPYRIDGKDIACEYCDFRAVCRFDAWLPDSGYRELASRTREQILEEARRSAGGS